MRPNIRSSISNTSTNYPPQANEQILLVPTSTLRTINTVRPKIKKSLPKETKVQAILAAELALDKPTSQFSPWNAVVPSREDIMSNLPLAWSDPHLHAYLPKSALALLRKQQSKFTRDWAAIQQAPPPLNTITRPDYLYTWLLANTRTFYVSNNRSYLDPSIYF